MEEYNKYKNIIREKLSEKRYRHSLCVADSAVELAKIHGGGDNHLIEKAYIAGLLHDIMKDAGSENQLREILSAIKRYKNTLGIFNIDELTMHTSKLLHAPAGAAYMHRELGIADPELLAAVRYHTTARAGMSLLEKVVYAADFISADRIYPDVYVMRAIAPVSLNQAMRYALCYTIRDLAEKGTPIHPDTVSAFNQCVINDL